MTRRAKNPAPSRYPWIFPAAVLVFVFGSLILGATFQVPAGDAPRTLRADALDLPPAGDSPYGEPRADGDAEPPTRMPGANDVARRAERDVERIAGDASGYTLQLSVVCDPDNARSLAADVDGDPRLFLLPVMLDERACLRVCWGVYEDRGQAERATDLPDNLRDRIASPAPRPIAGLLP